MLAPTYQKKQFYSSAELNLNVSNSVEINKSVSNLAENYLFEAETYQGLPKFATANDLREVVRFFRDTDSNITLMDFLALEPQRVFDKRKLSAYLFWGIICFDNDFINITEFGLELAKRIESERSFYRQIIASNTSYFAAINWIATQNTKIIHYQKLIAFWEQNFPECLIIETNQKEKDLEAIAASFFSLCHAAEFGTMIIGKRGQPTRLNVNSEEIREFIETQDLHKPTSLLISPPAHLQHKVKVKIYLSAKDKNDTNFLMELSDLANLDFCLMTEFKTENRFSDTLCLQLMKQCDLGLFILDSNSCVKKNGNNARLLEETIAEINSALALYSSKVVICWNSDDQPPPEIQETNLLVVSSKISEWTSNIKILRLLKRFITDSDI